MIWLTFNGNRLFEVHIGGIPEGDYIVISEEQYQRILETNSYDYWIKEGDNIVKVEGEIPKENPILVVTMRQARRALYQMGYMDQIELFMKDAPQEFKIDWEYATEVHRDNDLVDYMRQLLQLTQEQVDDLFTLAYSL